MEHFTVEKNPWASVSKTAPRDFTLWSFQLIFFTTGEDTSWKNCASKIIFLQRIADMKTKQKLRLNWVC